MAHVWEILWRKRNWRNEWITDESNPNEFCVNGKVNPEFSTDQLQKFTDDVNTFLKGPEAAAGWQVDLTSKRSEFDKPSGRIFIMTPEMPYANIKPMQPVRFPRQLAALQRELEAATGIKPINMDITLYNAPAAQYLRNNPEKPQNFAHGRALYLFV